MDRLRDVLEALVTSGVLEAIADRRAAAAGPLVGPVDLLPSADSPLVREGLLAPRVARGQASEWFVDLRIVAAWIDALDDLLGADDVAAWYAARPVSPHLVCVHGPGAGTTHPLTGRTAAGWRIGRDADTDVRLAADPYVSRTHLVIARAGHGYTIRLHEGARNPAHADGMMLSTQAAPLVNGALLALGRTVLLFRDG